jgi:uncharacterized lipoprotein YddW (UPF0748 family)
MPRSRFQLLFAGLMAIFLATAVALAAGQGDNPVYLPLAARALPTPTPTPSPTPPAETVEFRGLWITRFNWTSISQTEEPADVDRMVDDAAQAGFNAILFQVRGVADAYYASNVEPWSERLTGTLGQNPGWDPLARMIERAHARGIQVHAYINVYPVWTCGDPPPSTSPQHLYHLLVAEHDITTDGKPHGLQWTTGDDIHCSGYQRATPASFFVDDHLMAVATDIVSRYDVDGLHLDHIRYGGSNTSCDPVSESEERANVECFTAAPEGYASYGDWQRVQVNGTVWSFYDTLFAENEGVAQKPGFMLSGAVWPYYDSGVSNYYQDSKAWLAGGYIDAIMPMLYGSFDTSPGVWKEYAAGFQADNAGRFVIPGIHGGFFAGEPGTFEDIAQRIEAARQLGTAGHAIFAYNYLAANDYFDDLAAGPYAAPAVPPAITWHP